MEEKFYKKFIKENPPEVIIAKLIQNDERAKEILELKKHYEHEQEYINGKVFSSKQMHFIDENYIDKSKVKEKIEELYEREWVLNEIRDELIDVLEELLESED